MQITPEHSRENPEKLLLRAREVCQRLSLGRATVYLMMASGELPVVRIGRAVRVPAKALDQWVAERTT